MAQGHSLVVEPVARGVCVHASRPSLQPRAAEMTVCTLARLQVIFRADGSFLAPAENCERAGNPKCKWSADDDRVFVTCALVTRHTPPNSACPPHGSTWCEHVRARRFGDAGLHTLSATPDQQMLNGHRDSDGDSVSAQRVA